MKVEYKFVQLNEVDKACHEVLLLEQVKNQKWYSASKSKMLNKEVLLLTQ